VQRLAALARRLAGADATHLLLPAAGACLAAVGLMGWGARRVGRPYAPHSGRPGDYRWISAAPTRAARLSAWGGYALHQLAIWGCIYAAQRRRPAYSAALRPINYAALGVNAAGVALHYAQTRRHYDGLAPDVPEATALGSVAFLLMLTLVLESPRRGLAFGDRRLRLDPAFVGLARRYHGYVFSWAVIYTFWYHPMEPRPAHLAGLYHTLLLLLQSSLLFNKAHLDRRWGAALELMVLPHSLITALMNRNQLAPMFAFGFMGTALAAQANGLGLRRRTRIGLAAAWLLAAVAVYARRGRLRRLHEIAHVPLLEYAVVAALYGLFLLLKALARLSRPPQP
jgi:hypothetical protein